MKPQIVPESRRVGFGPRLLAYVIDNFLVSVITIVLLNLLSPDTLQVFSRSGDVLRMLMSAPDTLSADQTTILQSIRSFNGYLSAVTIIYMLMEAYSGATLGKRLLSLQITDLSGRIAPPKKYILRYILKNMSGLAYILSLSLGSGFILSAGQFVATVMFIGFFLTLNAQAMGFHDMISGTLVIRTKDLESSGGNHASRN